MIRVLQNLSIQWKLVTFVTLTSAISALVSGAAFVSYQMRSYRAATSASVMTEAQILAYSCKEALAAEDAQAAKTSLAALEREPHILGAALYGKNGEVFAQYSRGKKIYAFPAQAPSEGIGFDSGGIWVAQRVSLDRDVIGIVFLKRDVSDKEIALRRSAAMALMVVLVCLVAAGLSASALQKLISRPIFRLAQAAERVAKAGDYDIGVEKTTQDEVGALIDHFNEVLGQIQNRDEALQRAKDEVEDRVLERTLELQAEIAEREQAQNDVMAAKEAAEASDRAKSVFLANMSHELRTPLNAIIGYSAMLEEDALQASSPAVSDLRRINRAGKHLLDMINDVLDISKIDANRMRLFPERVSVGEIIDEAIGTVEPLVKKNQNTLVVDCPDREAQMFVDLIKFRQSLLNLLSNAGKFTKDGTVTLRVEKIQHAGKEWIDWAVKDTGIGIADENMDKLFCAFSQVDVSPARRHSGTGLGLAISKRLCELMGGTIRVQSAFGIGSTFTIRVPLLGAEPCVEEEGFTLQLAQLGLASRGQSGVQNPTEPKDKLKVDRELFEGREGA